MDKLTDYNGLFNCLRPDAPQGYGTFDEQEPELSDCDYCKSYNGEKATAVFTLKDKFTGLIDILYLCKDCQDEDHIFKNKTILRATKL